MSDKYSIGIVGGRGHTGARVLEILDRHPTFEVVYAGSREMAGESVPQIEGLQFENLDSKGVADLGLDGYFLALPNGVGRPFAEAIADDAVIVDLSSDHRLAADWAYGLPELHRDKIAGARRIANPGCYATAAQLAIAPFVDDLSGVPAAFGVSGYSGAGTTPSPKNDPERLADNLLPYALVNHNHESEISFHLGHQVRFMPHVHPAFRGLIVTAHIPVIRSWTRDAAFDRVQSMYAGERLIEVVDGIPELRDAAFRPGAIIGGVDVSDDGHNIVVLSALDNLLKGAATEAVQNLNLAFGLDEFTAVL